MKKVFLIFILFISIVKASDGTINVFTGDKQAEIFIDSEFIAKEQVVKRPLQEGTHYIQIKKNDKVLSSKTVNITADKLETVVIDDFVDYKTNVASRGAIEVEAMRVRETRGNLAVGMHAGSPAPGLSLKWWPMERIGLQTIGYVNNFNGNIDSRGGTRLLFSLNESVYEGSTMTTYLAWGVGRSMIRNYSDGEKNETYDLTEGSVGLEFRIANFFGDPNKTEYKHVIVDGNTSPFDVLFSQLIIGIGEGFMKVAHLNLEFGVERMFTRFYSDEDIPSRTKIAGKVSGGFHVYF